jgi:hypothetical protein
LIKIYFKISLHPFATFGGMEIKALRAKIAWALTR